jgi:uncharacterized protein (DUF2141 family)
MKKNLLLFLVIVGLSANAAFATTYYVSTSGDDANSGISKTTPWKTLNKVSTTNFSPGDSILFRSGEIFVGNLVISSSGTSGNPIIYGKYDTGARPYLAAQGAVKNTIYSYNKEYFELIDLKVTNYKQGNNVNDPINGELLRAVYIDNYRGGTLDHIYLTRMEITGVNSGLVPFDGGKEHGTRYFGGVHFEVRDDTATGTPVPSKFNDVVISGCDFHDLGRTALGSTSYWTTRSATSTFGQPLYVGGPTDTWYPSTGVVIRSNHFTNIDGNGLIWRNAAGTLIELNIFDTCGAVLSGNAAFCSSTDDTVFQYNEAKNTVYNLDGVTDENGNSTPDTDARGIDVDMKCKNTIVQYNYLHDNGKGGFVATGGYGESTNPNATMFTLGTIVRYNILEDNEQMGIVISGNCYDMTVHNNVIFSNSTIPNVQLVDIHDWPQGAQRGAPHDINFYSNIFWAKGTGASFNHESTTSAITYSHNLYHWTTTPPTNLPVVGYSSNTNIAEDGFSVIGNPLLKAAGGNSEGGYTLEAGSPAFNVGRRGLTQPTLGDYYKHTINNIRNIGVDQTPGISTSEYKIDINHTDNGSISAGWIGLIGTEGSQAAINGVRFTVFKSDGTRDRGTAGNVTRDFAYADGAAAYVGFRMEYLPAGTYDVSTYQYDPNFPGSVNIEYQEKGLPATMVVKASGKSLTNSSSTTFQITVEDGKDYEILVREASSEDRSRFNGISITPVATEGLTARKTAKADIESETVPVDDALMIFPNPVSSKFTISKNIKQDDNLKIMITDIHGRIIYSKDYSVLAGNWQLELNKDELKLARGVYYVTVQSATGKSETAGILVM